MKKRFNICAIGSLFILSSAFAQQPNSGTILKDNKLNNKLIKKELSVPTLEVVPLRKPLQMKDEAKIFVKEFKITNNSKISQVQLKPILKEYENKELTFSQIKELAYKISQFYRSKGYLVARAYIPAQDIVDNIVEITIIEGTYGEIILQNNSLVKTELIKNSLQKLKDTKIIESASLEREILNLAKTPGIKVLNTNLKAGQKVGTSDILIDLGYEDKISSYASIDNYGSKYTGAYRLMLGADINSPLHLGDKLSVAGLLSNNKALKYGNIDYELPLNSNGLKTNLSYTKTKYNLEKDYKYLDALGSANSYNVKVSYPFIRTRASELMGYVNYTFNKFVDEIRSTSTLTKKDSDVFVLGLDGYSVLAMFGLDNEISYSASFTHGNLDIKDSTSKSLDLAGANTNGNFNKINLSLSSLSNINEKFSLSTSLALQRALNKNLDGSEDFSVGGSSGVKAYPSGELSAENGYLLNAELFYAIANYNSKVSLFSDVGRAYMVNNVSSFQARTLKDIGLGYYYNKDKYNFKLLVAKALGDSSKDSESRDTSLPRVLFQMAYLF